MQFIPPLSAILLLIGTTFSLQAIPMFEEGEGRARQKSTPGAEKEEAAGRRISEPSSAGEASMDQGHFYRQDGSQELQSDSMERNSISSGTAGAATASTVLPSTEKQDPHASEPAATAGGSLEGHSVAAVDSRTSYRHGPQGWQLKDATTGTWQATEKFADKGKAEYASTPPAIHRAAVTFFGNNYNRSETIDKRKAAFQAGLCQEKTKTTSPESEHRIFGLQHLIAVLEKASSYQNAMVSHLQESPAPRSIPLQISLQKSCFSKINESPNKIEKIAHQLEVNIKDLLTDQALLDIVEAHSALHITLGELPRHLLETKEKLINRIRYQKASIEAKAAYATLLPPPYEVIDKATQAAIDQRALTYKKEMLFNRIPFAGLNSDLNAVFCRHYEKEMYQQAAEEAQKPQQREQVIALFNQSADLRQKAADVYATDQRRGDLLSNAGRSFFCAAREAQEPQPRGEVITFLTQSADLYQQAAAAYAIDERDRGMVLFTAGCSFVRAAEEAQQPQPRGQAITFLTQSADLFQQAAAAYAKDDRAMGIALGQAGECFFSLLLEDEQPQPRERAITFLNQSAYLCQQAAAVYATGDRDKGWSLANAGEVFFSAAKEAQKLRPQEQAITFLDQSADLYQQSANAFAAVHMHRGNALFNAGSSFFYAAEQASKLKPKQDIIDGHLREARENIKKAN